MKYYSELSKIVKGALSGDQKRVVAYVQLLVEKLQADGEVVAAKGLQANLTSMKQVNPAMVKAAKLHSESGLSRPVPVEKDNRLSLADKTFPNPNDSVVFLTDHDQDIVNSFVSYIKKKDELESVGVPINPTLLLHGRPGTGKSKLASSLAAALQLPLITARADALISSYLGSTSKNIRSLLEYAQVEPCVLFLDEFDAIAKARDDRNEIGELKRVVVSLLQNIDNLGDTILVAATNHVHLLDPAIGRRFHYKLELLEPRASEREKLFNLLLKRFPLSNLELESVVEFSEGMTGAEIEIATYDYLRSVVILDKEFNSIELIKNLLKLRYDWLDFSSENKVSCILRLKEVSQSQFTGKILSRLWGISPSYISKILKENS